MRLPRSPQQPQLRHRQRQTHWTSCRLTDARQVRACPGESTGIDAPMHLSDNPNGWLGMKRLIGPIEPVCRKTSAISSGDAAAAAAVGRRLLLLHQSTEIYGSASHQREM
jgi:hypothetical protein